jgi:hypothetical protein
MAQKKDNIKKSSPPASKPTNKTPSPKTMTSAQLTQKAAGYLLAASNAAKREQK